MTDEVVKSPNEGLPSLPKMRRKASNPDVAPTSSSTRETNAIRVQSERHAEASKPANKKLRWTTFEQKMLFENFGRHITEKRSPSGSEINVFAKMISNSRTQAQIRTQINNYIKKKNNCFPDV